MLNTVFAQLFACNMILFSNPLHSVPVRALYFWSLMHDCVAVFTTYETQVALSSLLHFDAVWLLALFPSGEFRMPKSHLIGCGNVNCFEKKTGSIALRQRKGISNVYVFMEP